MSSQNTEINWRAKLLQTGADLAVLDSLLVGIYLKRVEVAHRVIQAKVGIALQEGVQDELPYGPQIFAPDREDMRLDVVAELARTYGVNPNFARAMEYWLIDEGCKVQADFLQTGRVRLEPATQDEMRRNLLELTAQVADTYDESYDGLYPATHEYLRYESDVLHALLSQLPSRHLALDLGCATAGFTLKYADKFEDVVAVDISPDMCRVASDKVEHAASNITVIQGDIESDAFWDQIANNSVCLVTMSFGTASDVSDIGYVIRQIDRVLRRGGKALLSFYNRDALVYSFDFLPWRASLAAVLDPGLKTLTVNTTYVLSANAYSPEEIYDMRMPNSIHIKTLTTFPTLLPVVPPETCSNPVVEERFLKLDLERAAGGGEDGAYIVCVLSK
jgi:SAM-dependent methyltransferase